MITDYLGRVIKVGDRIVYPGRQGKSMWLSDARVTEVRDDVGVVVLDTKGRLRRSDRCVVVEPPDKVRYYKHHLGFLDSTVYVRREGPVALLVGVDYSLSTNADFLCIDIHVKEGTLIEITQEEADDLLRKAAFEKAKKQSMQVEGVEHRCSCGKRTD